MANRVLLIDDDDQDLALMSEALNSGGLNLEIHKTNSGEDGLNLANELKPLIVVTDTNLLGMDGFETCRRLKELDEENIQVIICTGVIDAVNAGEARAAGADGYCVKTEDYEALINELRGVIQ